MTRATLRKHFKAYLRREGKTQNQAARDLNISHTHLSQILSGKRHPSLTLAVQIEALTGIDARDFAEVA